MSSGFAGSGTKGMEGFDREVESRPQATKKLDVFTDEFSPPGVSETSFGQDVSKTNNNYQAKHTDTVPEAGPAFTGQRLAKKRLAPAGDAKDQPKLDAIDLIEQRYQAKIKPPSEQFPGADPDRQDPKTGDVADNANFDPYSVDPARLSKIDGPESFHKHMEKRLGPPEDTVSYGNFRGMKYEVYYTDGKWYWEAANTTGTATSRADGVEKAKEKIEQFIKFNSPRRK